METRIAGAPAKPLVDWFPRSVLSGFVATITAFAVLLAAYGISAWLGSGLQAGADTASREMVGRWFYGLTHNRLVDIAQGYLYFAVAVHFGIGLVWAALYGYLFEPRLWGSGWVKGLAFSLLPWLLSLTVFFPLVGAGFLGLELGAGPLPIIGNLVLHLVFGGSLGLMYSLPIGVLHGDEEAVGDENARAMSHSELFAAWGIIAGILIGGAAGIAVDLITGSNGAPSGLSQLAYILGAIVLGGTVGALVGSLLGLPAAAPRPRHR